MSEFSIYTVTPRQSRILVRDALYAGLVPYLHSSPGIGKSSIMATVANDLNLAVIDHRLSTSGPEDMSGLPGFREDGRAVFKPFADLFPLEGDAVPEGKDGWMLFLDEMPAAIKQVQAASFKLILDRMTGQHRLNQRCVITAAGNLMSDRSIVNSISTGMQSRLIHLEMVADFNEWLLDVAIPENYDHRVIAYLSQYPNKLMDFNPSHANKTFCCPRTWEFANKLVKTCGVGDDKTALYTGCMTPTVAIEFLAFTKCYASIVTFAELIQDPENCRLPHDNNGKWATISSMMEHITDGNFEKAATYAGRFDIPFRVLFFRMVMVYQPKLRRHPAFAKEMVTLQNYLME